MKLTWEQDQYGGLMAFDQAGIQRYSVSTNEEGATVYSSPYPQRYMINANTVEAAKQWCEKHYAGNGTAVRWWLMMLSVSIFLAFWFMVARVAGAL